MSCRKLIGIALWFLGNYLGVYCIAIADNLFLRILGWLWVSSAISFAGVFMMLAWMHKENHHPDGSSFDP
jgi:hypothetical protein